VYRSLVELPEYAGRLGIRLGIENRYHYLEIPLLDEMGRLLEAIGDERVGFWYDVGHAHTRFPNDRKVIVCLCRTRYTVQMFFLKSYIKR